MIELFDAQVREGKMALAIAPGAGADHQVVDIFGALGVPLSPAELNQRLASTACLQCKGCVPFGKVSVAARALPPFKRLAAPRPIH